MPAKDKEFKLIGDFKAEDLHTVRGYFCAMKEISENCPKTSDLQTMAYEIALLTIESEMVQRGIEERE